MDSTEEITLMALDFAHAAGPQADGTFYVGEAGADLVAILVFAAVHEADAKALRLLRDLFADEDWHAFIVGTCREIGAPLPVFFQLAEGREEPGWERLIVQIAPADTERGNRRNADWCPVARALRRLYPRCRTVVVGLEWIIVGSLRDGFQTATPPELVAFIEAWDDGRPVWALRFELAGWRRTRLGKGVPA